TTATRKRTAGPSTTASSAPTANVWTTKARISISASTPVRSRYQQEHDHKNDENKRTVAALALSTGSPSFRVGATIAFVFAFNRFADQIDSLGKSAFVVAGFEMRGDVTVLNVKRHQIGKCPF